MIFNTVYKKSGGGIELSSIAVKTPPTVTEYKADETIDVSGMVLEATYSNGATRSDNWIHILAHGRRDG